MTTLDGRPQADFGPSIGQLSGPVAAAEVGFLEFTAEAAMRVATRMENTTRLTGLFMTVQNNQRTELFHRTRLFRQRRGDDHRGDQPKAEGEKQGEDGIES